MPDAPLRAIIAAELLATCTAEPTAPHARRQAACGDVTVTLTRGNCVAGWHWGLSLYSGRSILPHEADLWAAAVGAPSTDWDRTQDAQLWHCAWTEARGGR